MAPTSVGARVGPTSALVAKRRRAGPSGRPVRGRVASAGMTKRPLPTFDPSDEWFRRPDVWSGIVLGAWAATRSFGPSLMPRATAHQAMVSGAAAATGFAVGNATYGIIGEQLTFDEELPAFAAAAVAGLVTRTALRTRCGPSAGHAARHRRGSRRRRDLVWRGPRRAAFTPSGRRPPPALAGVGAAARGVHDGALDPRPARTPRRRRPASATAAPGGGPERDRRRGPRGGGERLSPQRSSARRRWCAAASASRPMSPRSWVERAPRWRGVP